MRLLIPLLPCLALTLMGCPKTNTTPPPERVQFERGMKSLQTGDTDAAVASFSTALRLNRQFPPAYWALSQLAVDKEQYDRAIQILQTLRQFSPGEPGVVSRLAELQNMSGRFLQAAPLAQEAARRDPKDAMAQAQLALIYEGTGQITDAIAALKKARELAPNSELAPLTLVRLLAETGAIDEAWTTLEAFPKEPKLKAQFHYVKGWFLSEYGHPKPDLSAALRELDSALMARPDYPAALQQKGHVLLQQGKTAEAEPLLQKAGKLGGSTVALLSDLATLMERKGDPKAKLMRQQAEQTRKEEKEHAQLRRRYLESPTDADSTLKLARLEALQGNPTEAQRLVMDILKKDPNNTVALEMVEKFMVRSKPK